MKPARVFVAPLLLLVCSACAVGQQQVAVSSRLAEERREEQAAERSRFHIRITCPENADRVLGGETLQPPAYSYEVEAGRSYPLVLHLPDGRMYQGTVRAVSPGSYGKYPGYDVCVDPQLLKQIDAGGSPLRFMVTSPKGEQVLEVTLGR